MEVAFVAVVLALALVVAGAATLVLRWCREAGVEATAAAAPPSVADGDLDRPRVLAVDLRDREP